MHNGSIIRPTYASIIQFLAGRWSSRAFTYWKKKESGISSTHGKKVGSKLRKFFTDIACLWNWWVFFNFKVVLVCVTLCSVFLRLPNPATFALFDVFCVVAKKHQRDGVFLLPNGQIEQIRKLFWLAWNLFFITMELMYIAYNKGKTAENNVTFILVFYWGQ